MTRVIVLLLALLAAGAAHAQQVIQGGPTVPPVPGHVPRFITNQMIGDSGPANGGPPGYGITELNVTNTTGIAPVCINDNPTTLPYHQMCFGSNVMGNGGYVSYGQQNGASPKSFTVGTAGPLILNSSIQDIEAKNLPTGGGGTVSLCVNPTTGLLSMASSGVLCGGGPAPVIILTGGGVDLTGGGVLLSE